MVCAVKSLFSAMNESACAPELKYPAWEGTDI